MAVTRISGRKRLLDGSIVTAKLADAAVTEAKIADAAVTPSKIDSTQNYTFNQVTAKGAVTVDSTLNVTGKIAGSNALEVTNDITGHGNLTIDGNGTIGGNFVITGNLTVQGDQVVANTSVMEVEDKNITINKGGTTSTLDGSGITVDNTDKGGNKYSFIVDTSTTAGWKMGILGSEVETVVVSGSQTLSDKTYMLIGDPIESQNNIEDALRALDNKVNTGTAYKVEEGDTTSSNYNSADSSENNNPTWAVGEAIQDNTPVHVYVSGVRLRSGTKDSQGNISNDYAVDYANGKVIFAEAPEDGSNIIIEYIAAS